MGVIGYGSLIPENYRVVFPTQTCNGDTPPPSQFVVNFKLIDFLSTSGRGYKGTKTVHDSAHAIYDNGATTPKNADALKSLARLIFIAFLNEIFYRHDIVYAGIIAPDMDSHHDQVEWQMDDTGCSTRLTAVPLRTDPEDYMHADLIECDWDGIGVRAFTPNASFASGKLTLPVIRLYIKDGKLVSKASGNQSITICP